MLHVCDLPASFSQDSVYGRGGYLATCSLTTWMVQSESGITRSRSFFRQRKYVGSAEFLYLPPDPENLLAKSKSSSATPYSSPSRSPQEDASSGSARNGSGCASIKAAPEGRPRRRRGGLASAPARAPAPAGRTPVGWREKRGSWTGNTYNVLRVTVPRCRLPRRHCPGRAEPVKSAFGVGSADLRLLTEPARRPGVRSYREPGQDRAKAAAQ